VVVPGPAAPGAAAPGSLHFTLSGIRFEGNTVISEKELQALTPAFLGNDVSLAQVNELADKVTALYRNRGYILSRAIVPAQRIDRGILVIRIIEAGVDKVDVRGDAGGATDLLKAYGARIAQDHPLTAAVLERELLLANDLSGLQLRSVLTPSHSVTGAADLSLLVTPRPIEGYVALDNRGSRYLGPYELMAGVFFNDLLDTGGRLGLSGVLTPDDGPDLAYGALSFDQPLNTDGLRFFGTASFTQTQPGSTLRALGTRGKALNLAGSLSYPVIRSRDFNLTLSGNFGYRNVRSDNDAVSPLFRDHVRAVDAGLFMNLLDNWGGSSSLSLTLTQGLDILGATVQSSPDKSHANASGVFTRASFEASHTHPLIRDVSITLAAGGQTAFRESLLASEQYALGGNAFNRAFDPSEVTGDAAIAGRAELQWQAITRLLPLSDIAPYGFYEGGQVWQSQPLPGEARSDSLFSAGAGLRFVIASRLSADVEWAKPLDHDVAAAGNRDSRFFFSVSTEF
jgi:hemolysin activation/secretion protein